MLTPFRSTFFFVPAAGLLLASLLSPAHAAPITKANNADNLNFGSSWIGGTPPGAADIAIWDNTVTSPNFTLLGATTTWDGLRILDPDGTVTINIGANTFNIGNTGIDMSNATANLLITGGASNIVTHPAGDLAINIAAGRQLEIQTRIEQSGRFVKSGDGTLLLTGTSDNAGTQATVNGGTVILAKASNAGVHALGGGTHIANAGGTFQLGGTGNDQIFIGATVTLNAGGTLDMNGRNEGFNHLTGIGTVTNSAAATASTLTLGLHTGDSTFSGQINDGAGTVALVKTGAGIRTLSGTNTYSGPTTVAGGTLLINNTAGSGVGSGNVTVNGGTLGGTGTVSGAVAINTTGVLSPGASIGTFGTGALSLNTGSTFAYELNTTAITGVRLDANGNLSFDGTVTLSLTDLGSNSLLALGSKFTLISYFGTWDGNTFSGFADDSEFTMFNNEWRIDYNDVSAGSVNGGTYSNAVTLTVIPEPGTALLGGLGLLFLLRRRR